MTNMVNIYKLSKPMNCNTKVSVKTDYSWTTIITYDRYCLPENKRHFNKAYRINNNKK